MFSYKRLIIVVRFLVVAIAWLGIQACSLSTAQLTDQASLAQKEQMPVVYYKEFGERKELLLQADIFALTAKQLADFEAFRNKISNQDVLRHQLVANYLQKAIEGFNYHSKTYIAAESAEYRTGNCLSLAILTTALAQAADIEVGYELMRTPPVYQKKGNVILSSQHIRSILHKPISNKHNGWIQYMAPVLKIDYFPTERGQVQRRVSHAEFVSMYYRNIAAEAIIEKRLNVAFWNLIESLKYTENDAHATNMLALVYDNAGYTKDAENLYKFGIKHATNKLELYSNYHKFLLRDERFAEASEIKLEIDKLDIPNPFDWLDLANEALAAGKLNDALKYYDKVVDLAPYLHDGYSGKGKVLFLKGENQLARKAFAKAEELSLASDTRAIYQAKLSALLKITQN